VIGGYVEKLLLTGFSGFLSLNTLQGTTTAYSFTTDVTHLIGERELFLGIPTNMEVRLNSQGESTRNYLPSKKVNVPAVRKLRIPRLNYVPDTPGKNVKKHEYE